eukprot:gene1325-biopygen1054
MCSTGLALSRRLSCSDWARRRNAGPPEEPGAAELLQRRAAALRLHQRLEVGHHHRHLPVRREVPAHHEGLLRRLAHVFREELTQPPKVCHALLHRGDEEGAGAGDVEVLEVVAEPLRGLGRQQRLNVVGGLLQGGVLAVGGAGEGLEELLRRGVDGAGAEEAALLHLGCNFRDRHHGEGLLEGEG